MTDQQAELRTNVVIYQPYEHDTKQLTWIPVYPLTTNHPTNPWMPTNGHENRTHSPTNPHYANQLVCIPTYHVHNAQDQTILRRVSEPVFSEETGWGGGRGTHTATGMLARESSWRDLSFRRRTVWRLHSLSHVAENVSEGVLSWWYYTLADISLNTLLDNNQVI